VWTLPDSDARKPDTLDPVVARLQPLCLLPSHPPAARIIFVPFPQQLPSLAPHRTPPARAATAPVRLLLGI